MSSTRPRRTLVARFKSTQRIIGESFASADDCDIDYRKVSVAVFPLRVLVLKDEQERYWARTAQLFDQVKAIENPIQRVFPLEQVLGAISGASSDVVEGALREFEAACSEVKDWQVDRS